MQKRIDQLAVEYCQEAGDIQNAATASSRRKRNLCSVQGAKSSPTVSHSCHSHYHVQSGQTRTVSARISTVVVMRWIRWPAQLAAVKCCLKAVVWPPKPAPSAARAATACKRPLPELCATMRRGRRDTQVEVVAHWRGRGCQLANPRRTSRKLQSDQHANIFGQRYPKQRAGWRGEVGPEGSNLPIYSLHTRRAFAECCFR